MKKFLIIAGVIVVIALVFGVMNRTSKSNVTAHLNEKIYVAVESKGVVAVIDPLTRTVVKEIDLSSTHDGEVLMYMPHNVQVAPDGRTVWVTANAHIPGQEHSHSLLSAKKALAHGDEVPFDMVIVIDAATDTIAGNISLAPEAHLAHVALTPDSKVAYVTAQIEGAIYKLDAQTYTSIKRIPVAQGSEPHGLRISPDGRTAYVAVLKGKALGMLDTSTDTFTTIPLKGSPVQTAVTPDGHYVVASVYDTKSLAVIDLTIRKDSNINGGYSLEYIDLPAGAKGPIQMYPTPDSKFIYLADQGYYYSQPEGNTVYKIDLAGKSVVKEIRAGRAPHGVVLNSDGTFVYVTNLLSGDVSVIDVATDTEVAKIPVGKEPNGISYWKR
jgi:YVTN family beta-propeller protein